MDFSGSSVAIVTPFDNKGRVDADMFKRLIQIQVAGGTQSIVVCGTTGESPTLETEEQIHLFSLAKAALQGSGVTLIAGTGSNCTKKSVQMTQKAKDIGVDGCLIVTPYYNKPNAAGLQAHYEKLNEVDVPLVMYNIPGRTGVNIPPSLMKSLCRRFSNIKAIKASNGDLDEVTNACAMLHDHDVQILSGDDGLTVPIMSVGGVGVVSVLANVIPKVMSQLVNLYAEGQVKRASRLAQLLHPLCGMSLGLAPNPVPMKSLMCALGLDVGGPRLPLVALESNDVDPWVQAFKKQLAEIEGAGYVVDSHFTEKI